MKQAIVILLETDGPIQRLRKKYFPNHDKFHPHITLVYPFEIKDPGLVREHIFSELRGSEPFEITLRGVQKSAVDYYLYLLVDESKEAVIALHKKLNSGLLSSFENTEMPEYIPHLTLGVFSSENALNDAVDEVIDKNIFFKKKIDSIQLLTLNEDLSLKHKEDFFIEHFEFDTKNC